MKTVYEPRYRKAIHQLRAARHARGITQEQLAKATGIRRRAISAIETVERRADLLDVLLIAEAVGFDLSELQEL